jgi:hypothetical protein
MNYQNVCVCSPAMAHTHIVAKGNTHYAKSYFLPIVTLCFTKIGGEEFGNNLYC